MKVLLNGLQAGNRSGTGRYTEELARRLPGMAPDVEVMVLWPETLPLPPGAAGDAFIRRPVDNGRRRIWLEQMGMGGEMSRLGADVAHYPANIGNFALLRKTVLTVHDLGFIRNPSWSTRSRAVYHRFAVGRGAKRARRIIADSEATAKDLHDFLGIGGDHVDVIPLGVDEAFRPASWEAKVAVREKYDLPQSFFLYMGTLEPRKNIPRLIVAWSGIAAHCQDDLVIAGRHGWKYTPVREAVRASAHADRIYFPGFIDQEDLPALLSAAHAFVWPSLWEGFGLPPLEAMACGVPVLTSDKSSLPEVVGDAGLMVDPYNTEAIAQGLLRLAKDEKLRETLRERGMARAREFTWQRTAELTLDAYRHAAG